MTTKNYLYAVRDKKTGKLVRDITNPGHKFWEKKGSCQMAVDNYNNGNYYSRRKSTYDLEIVTFALVEVSTE